jgi:lipopolysaccharide transport system ATP-binding protein
MSDTVIQVENLSKKYIIGHQQEGRYRYTTLRDSLTGGVKSIRAKFLNPARRSIPNPAREEFWALKDVSFEIKQGDRVGVIGRNGAWKIDLIEDFKPNYGADHGAHFDQRASGKPVGGGNGFSSRINGAREYLFKRCNSGMSRVEIKRKFDEIVDFAEVAKFLDTPVKRYSSGMYVRLAFAVAAYLEPEILIVDEVLAVGDAQFQKKCLGKMQNVASEGRTIIFVSHQMAAISNLCSSCMMLQSGGLIFYGRTESAINYYLEAGNSRQIDTVKNLQSFRPAWAKSLIISARILDLEGQEKDSFLLGSDITFEMTFATPDASYLKAPVMGIVINHATFGTIGGVNTRMTGFETYEASCASATMRCTLKQIPFLQGNYTVDVWLGDGSIDVDTLTGYLSFRIEETDIYGTGRTPFNHMGVIFLEPSWKIISH